ncbi:SMI1/KNR4 family protein [Paenibacillus sonchi]|uniref:SMI1/KNR4 family protein n=1 Tax=Paenibacillus sonchi TaxID=373687 RepID=A0A974SCS3_9BACL|nr:SMI1/KNR4 family protein [Paenibacillus sonchi]QQZ60521.1 SMI1/KNR4 family protein [Paenibacillus sonchi]
MKEISEQFNLIEEHLYTIGLPSRDVVYSEVDITKIEEKYNISFPEIYKLFVLKYGNSKFEQEVIYKSLELSPCTDKNGFNAFDSFFGFDGGLDDVSNKINQYYERIPSSLIPIADDGKGNLICIGVKDGFYEKIYFWYHENELIANLMLNEKKYGNISLDDYWENVFLVSDSFVDFIRSFEVEQVEEGQKVELKIVKERMNTDFIANMLAARAELEAKEKERKDKKNGKG